MRSRLQRVFWATIAILILVMGLPLPLGRPYGPVNAQPSPDTSAVTPVDGSVREVRVLGQSVGNPGGYPFAGWYTDSAVVDGSTDTAIFAWVSTDTQGDRDAVYLMFMRFGDWNATKAVERAALWEDVVSLDSLAVGGGVVLVTMTETEPDGSQTDVYASIFTTDGQHVWSGLVADADDVYEEYSKACWVPGWNAFLVVWWNGLDHHVYGRTVAPDGTLGTVIDITDTDSGLTLSWRDADQILCVGGSDKALVVYRYLDSDGDLGTSARFVRSDGSVSAYVSVYDYFASEEVLGVRGAYLSGYFLVPFLSGGKVGYAVLSESSEDRVYYTSYPFLGDGRHPYAISAEDRFVLTWVSDDNNGDVVVGNVDPATWDMSSVTVESTADYAEHPIVAHDPTAGEYLLVWTGGSSPGEYDVRYAVLSARNPDQAPAISSGPDTLVSDQGDQVADALGLVATDKFAVLFRDWRDGEVDLSAFVSLPSAEAAGAAEVYLLPDQGADYKARLLDLIDSATSEVFVAVAFFQDMDVAQALADAKARGVDVRVIVDDSPGNAPVVSYLTAQGVPVLDDSSLGDPDHIMHDKFFVIDGRWLVVATTNLIPEDLTTNSNAAVVIEATAPAYHYRREFLQMWNGGAGKFGVDKDDDMSFLAFLDVAGRTVRVEGYFTPMYYGYRTKLPDHISWYVNRSTSHVYFASYIFTTSWTVDSIADALVSRHDAGVDVRGVMDEILNLNTPGRRSYDLMAEGIPIAFPRVYPYKTHDKLFTVDGEVAIIGSYNPTGSATLTHDENVFVIVDPSPAGISAQIEAHVEDLFTTWYEPDYSWTPTHLTIDRVAFKPDDTGTPTLEWVTLYNPTGSDVPLDSYAIGDVDNLYGDADDALYQFPPGYSVPPGGYVVVAYSAADFRSIYRYRPDFEIAGTDPGVPDLVPLRPSDFSGSWNLDDAGDEIVLVEVYPDSDFLAVIDAAWYGSSAYLPSPLDTTPLTLYGGFREIAAGLYDVDPNERYGIVNKASISMFPPKPLGPAVGGVYAPVAAPGWILAAVPLVFVASAVLYVRRARRRGR